MFTARLSIDQYRQVGIATDVAQASPHQLIVLLFDGAIAALQQARHAIAHQDADTRRRATSKAMRIIDEGLKAAVSSRGDAALAANLNALYDHMVGRLFQANARGIEAPLAEVGQLLEQLRSAWVAITPRPLPQSQAVRA
ncbi:flagellar export chaperone FliS [Ramlibacter sp. AW1]|uniref:Flagellar secretion chaperone FliS n=1 Tax=Ramlibacter aurantiacus TaxID=2801330 RepID=A0A937D5L7_9BURK|nr:flagellar export chaperone FliS [Ramlibacter aurantiacus]MBL0421447.1 flagellar export chaperone FliS [Ramlibacter aurantiacus]